MVLVSKLICVVFFWPAVLLRGGEYRAGLPFPMKWNALFMPSFSVGAYDLPFPRHTRCMQVTWLPFPGAWTL